MKKKEETLLTVEQAAAMMAVAFFAQNEIPKKYREANAPEDLVLAVELTGEMLSGLVAAAIRNLVPAKELKAQKIIQEGKWLVALLSALLTETVDVTVTNKDEEEEASA